MSLADPKTTRDQKDHALSMYLFERGADSMSFLTDIIRYKGEYTKESRVFQSRMRFDFESFVTMFINHLLGQGERIGKAFGIDIREEKKGYEAWLALPNNKGKNLNYRHYDMNYTDVEDALIESAIYDIDEADRLQRAVDNITQARMAQKGYGVYTDNAGRPFSINDPELDEIIKKDRELQEQAEKEQEWQ